MTSALITATELARILHQPHVRVLDASYNFPATAMGITNAVDFDIDDVADPGAPLAHTIPSEEVFSAKIGAMGVGNDDLVVVYDRGGIAMAAARAWWMFRLFGHGQVQILDGGLPAWVNAGYPLSEKTTPAAPVTFRASFRPDLVKDLDQVRENLSTRKFRVLDARDAERFRGEKPDPRPHVAAGHIPDSVNVPFMNLLTPDGMLKQKDYLATAFQSAHINLKESLACSCGSGVTACVVALALYELGCKDAAVYDGSWTEWGSNPALPKEKGN